MDKKSFLLLVFLLLLGGVYLLWPSDEKRIKKLFNEGIEAIESKNLDGVMSKISFNYRDEYGLTYVTLKRMLAEDFRVFTDLKVESGDLKIKVSGDTATAELKIRVLATAGNETGFIVGDPKEPVSLKVTLAREHAQWLVVKAEGFGFNASPYIARLPQPLHD